MTEFCADIDKLFTELPFEQRFKAAKSAGFSSVEFVMPEKMPLGKLGDLCAVDGLKPAMISLSDEQARLAFDAHAFDAFCELFEKVAETADFVEAPFIHIPAIDVADDKLDDAQAALADSLDEAAEIVKSYRKKILLGFKNPVENPQAYPSSISELLEILDEYDDDSTFGLMLDLYETQISEGGLSDALEKLMQFIGHIRIAGVPLRNEPDDGEVNYTYLLALLEAHGYAHAVSASYTPRAKTQTGLKWMKKFL